jgi:hypothetical protein
MTKPVSNNRWYTLASLVLALCFGAASHATAAEFELEAYTATYGVKGRGISLGTATISLQPVEDMWLWRTTTKANAFVSIFTRNKPFSETTFSWSGDGLRLQKILIADENNKKDAETASFDWDGGSMDVLRKGKQKQLQLAEEVYDLQSVHLLAAIMQAKQQQQASFKLYRKGKLIDSKLVYLGNGKVKVAGQEIEARIYEHSISSSDESLEYYYEAARPLLPLLIKTRKSGKNRSEMRLKKADWLL